MGVLRRLTRKSRNPKLQSAKRVRLSLEQLEPRLLLSTYQSPWGSNDYQDIIVPAGTHTFEVDGIWGTEVWTDWYAGGSYTGDSDHTYWLNNYTDPTHSHSFSSGTTYIEANCYDGDGGFLEWHGWNCTVDTTGPVSPQVEMDSDYDTGYRDYDGITKETQPYFEWNEPYDPGVGEIEQYFWQIYRGSTLVDEDYTSNLRDRPNSNLSDATNYSFYVIAQDTAYNWGTWSDPEYFTIDTTDPSSSTPYSPSGDITTTSPTIQWSYSSSTDWKYDVDLEYKTITGIWWNVSGWPKTATRTGSISAPDLSWETEYRVSVQEYDIAGNRGGDSSDRYFRPHDTTAPTQPGTPDLSASDDTGYRNYDNITKQTSGLTFSWSPSSDSGTGVAGYERKLDSGSWVSIGNTTSTDISAGHGGHTFYVRAKDNANPPNYSNPSSQIFTIDSLAPSVPNLKSPPDGATINTTTPTLEWYASSDSTSGIYNYQLTYETTALFDEVTVDVFGTSKQLPLDYDHWYWRVQATDKAGNQSSESTEWDFTITEQSVTIVDAWIQPGSWVDHDSDGFASELTLEWDANVNYGTMSVYAHLYADSWDAWERDLGTDTNYTLDTSTTTKSFTVPVDAKNIAHNTWDFQIDLYKTGTTERVARLGMGTDPELNDVKVELSSEEIQTAMITDARIKTGSWVDHDSDGFASELTLEWDAKVDWGTMSVYAHLYADSWDAWERDLGTDTNYTLDTSTTTKSFTVPVDAKNIAHNTWDFQVDLYKTGTTERVARLGMGADPELNDVAIELSSEDQTPIVTQIRWVNASSDPVFLADNGDSVYLEVFTDGGSGQVELAIKEEDDWDFDETVQPLTISITDGYGLTTWSAAYQSNDGWAPINHFYAYDSDSGVESSRLQVFDLSNYSNLGTSGIADLISDYAPIIRMDDDDHFEPNDVEMFTWGNDTCGYPLLRDGSGTTQDWDGTLVGLGDFTGSGYYLDLPASTHQDAVNIYDDFSSSYDNTIYATVVEHDDQNRLAVEYWFPYYMSDWGNQGGYNTHEGDWEGIVVTFDTEGPEKAAYSQHTEIPFVSWFSDDYKGGHYREWENVETINEHSVVYVGLGGHANYFADSDLVGGTPYVDPGNPFNSYTEWYDGNGDELIPGDNLQVQILPNSAEGWLGEVEWLNYGGHWGQEEWEDPDRFWDGNGPLGPSETERWIDPFAWLSDLPEDKCTIGERLDYTYDSIIEYGMDQYRENFGGKPVFGAGLGYGADLADLAAILGAAPTGGLSTLLSLLKVSVADVSITTYYDIADILDVTTDGQDGWITVWAEAGLSVMSLGAGIPVAEMVSLGIVPFEVDTLDDDPWQGVSGSLIEGQFGGVARAYGPKFDYTDDGFDGDWWGTGVGLFNLSTSIDALNITWNFATFEVQESVLRAASFPVAGTMIEDLLFEPLERIAGVEVVDSPSGTASLYDLLLAAANGDYSEPFIRPATEGSDDHGDDMLSATPIVVDNQVAGVIQSEDNAADVDVFSFIAPTGGMYEIAANTPESTLDPVVVVKDSNSVVIAEDDDGGPGLDSLALATIVQGETYYVEVRGWNGTETGAYVLMVSALPDEEDPTATLTDAPDIADNATYYFEVTYEDNVAVDVSDLDNNDIRVTGPNGYDEVSVYDSVDIPSNGTPRVATYHIIAPSGVWDETDNGTYTVWMEANEVTDTSENSVLAGVLGTFNVSIDTGPTILAWHSAKTHDRGVGEALLEIPDDGSFSEPRLAVQGLTVGGISTLLVAFDEAIDPASFTAAGVLVAGNDVNSNPVDLSGINISTSTRNGNTIGEITFSPALPDFARYLVRLDGITDVASNPLEGDNDRIMTTLLGDAYGDLRVNNTDVGGVKSLRGINPIDSGDMWQVRSDATLDGRINNTDVGGVKSVRGRDARFIPDPTLAMGSSLLMENQQASDPASTTTEPFDDNAGVTKRSVLGGYRHTPLFNRMALQAKRLDFIQPLHKFSVMNLGVIRPKITNMHNYHIDNLLSLRHVEESLIDSLLRTDSFL